MHCQNDDLTNLEKQHRLKTVFQNIVLVIGIVLGLFITFKGLSKPSTILDGFGVAIDNASARNEMRAIYGAMQLTIAIVMSLSLFGKLPKSIGLAVFFTHIGGIFMERVISLIAEGPRVFFGYTPMLQQLYAIDFIVACLSGYALYLSLKTRSQSELVSD